jgi:hypothetical protein
MVGREMSSFRGAPSAADFFGCFFWNKIITMMADTTTCSAASNARRLSCSHAPKQKPIKARGDKQSGQARLGEQVHDTLHGGILKDPLFEHEQRGLAGCAAVTAWLKLIVGAKLRGRRRGGCS